MFALESNFITSNLEPQYGLAVETAVAFPPRTIAVIKTLLLASLTILEG
jgi:hypothetical protein